MPKRGSSTSKFGLGLSISTDGEGHDFVDSAICCDCGPKVGWNWWPYRMTAIFETVDRVPWVPTEFESQWWAVWKIDEWFAPRRTVW
jgi:hypothetical protein